MKDICMTPIGIVERVQDSNVKDREVVSKVVLKNELVDALEGLDGFSHVWIIFWMHMASDRRHKLKTRPRGREGAPLLGVYATRSPSRPNPIGLTLVELLAADGNVLTVKGLDAFDGTPVLDLKPYDSWDRLEDYEVPQWWMEL